MMDDLRRWMRLVEMTGAPHGKIVAWHATSLSLQIDKVLPFMHLGTYEAAVQRGKRYKSFMLYEFELNVTKPLECRDGMGAQHPVEGMIEWLETKLQLRFQTVDRLLMQCRADQQRGIPPSLAGGRAVASVLRRRGYDFLWYKNAIEDPGSISWIVIDPSHVMILDKKHQLSSVLPPQPHSD
jgi:hypothetical protein